jgi:hypothetical protein
VELADQPSLTLDEFGTLMEKGCPGGFLTWWNRLLRRKAMREVFRLIDVDNGGRCSASSMLTTEVSSRPSLLPTPVYKCPLRYRVCELSFGGNINASA